MRRRLHACCASFAEASTRLRAPRLATTVLVSLAVLAGLACGQAPRTTELTEADLRAMVDTMVPSLARIAHLQAKQPVTLALRSREEVRAWVAGQLDRDLPPSELKGLHDVYALLGLLPDTLDLHALLLDLYSEQIAGYYDPETRQLYVVRGSKPDLLVPILAHELVHALQDQTVNLDSLISPKRGNDRQSAAQAALEGHATLVMLDWTAERATGQPVDPVSLPDPGAQIRPTDETGGDNAVFQRAPRIIQETLLFPYAAGASFVQTLWRTTPRDQQRAAPLGPLLPQSTEQVLDPVERFINQRDAPTELRYANDGGQVVYENTLGALETGIFLEAHLGSMVRPWTGWDGDRYRLLQLPAGQALVWTSIWDDDASAAQFAERAARILSTGAIPNPYPRRARVQRLTLDDRPLVRITITGAGLAPDAVPEQTVYCASASGVKQSCRETG